MNLRSILFACLAANGARAKLVRVACIGDSVTEGSKSDGQPWCKQIRGELGRNFFTTQERRRLLAEHKEVYVFDVTSLGPECVPCVAGACDVGECLPDTRRRGLRFGMSTSGCCRGA